LAGVSAWIERRPARAEHDELLQQRSLIMQYPDLDTPISPLRQRLIDDMNMLRFSRETQRNYLRDIGRLASFLGRSLDTATICVGSRSSSRTMACPFRQCDFTPQRTAAGHGA
jgi:hypothetical protein